MDGLIDIDSARALVSDAALWPRVRDFLWNFSSQIHPSWLENHPTIKLSNYPTALGSPRVSRWILREFSVEPVFHPFPADDNSRLLLLDSDTLLSIACWLGALASADALRRVTRGPDVAALKAALPGVFPAVFSYAPYFSKSALFATSRETAPAVVLSTGFSLLFSTLFHLPPALLRRFRLKLPASIPEQAFDAQAVERLTGQPAKPSNHQPAKLTNTQTVQLLLKLHFPEAFALCCS